jgi:hypothetical protein
MGVVSRVLERGVRRQREAAWEGHREGRNDREAGCMGLGRNSWGVIIVPRRYALPLSTVALAEKGPEKRQHGIKSREAGCV